MVILMDDSIWIIMVTLSVMAAVLGIRIYVRIKRQKRKLIEMKHSKE